MAFQPTSVRASFTPPNLDPNLIAHPAADISNGLESLFSNYMAYKQNQRAQTASEGQRALNQQQVEAGGRQAAAQNLNETTQFGAPLSSFNQGQIQQASQPEVGSVENPMIAHLRQGIDMIRSQRDAQLAEAGAQLEGTRAKTRGENALAAVNEGFAGGGSGGISGWAKTTADSVRRGDVAPSQAQTEATRVGPNGLGRLALDNALAGLPLSDLEAKFKGKESAATLENSAAIQVPARLQKSLMPSFDYLDTISQKADKSQYQLINKYGISLAAQKGDRLAQHLQDVSNAISEEFAANLGGTGSDAKLHLGMSLFDKAKTGDQIHDAVTFMRHNAINRSEAYLGKEPSAIPIPPQFGGPKSGPAVGDSEGGYRFKGGDPSKSSSWEKQ